MAPSGGAQPSNGRANLLESIRNAGGIGKAALRDVKDRKMEKRKQKEQEQGEGRGADRTAAGTPSASVKGPVATPPGGAWLA